MHRPHETQPNTKETNTQRPNYPQFRIPYPETGQKVLISNNFLHVYLAGKGLQDYHSELYQQVTYSTKIIDQIFKDLPSVFGIVDNIRL